MRSVGSPGEARPEGVGFATRLTLTLQVAARATILSGAVRARTGCHQCSPLSSFPAGFTEEADLL